MDKCLKCGTILRTQSKELTHPCKNPNCHGRTVGISRYCTEVAQQLFDSGYRIIQCYANIYPSEGVQGSYIIEISVLFDMFYPLEMFEMLPEGYMCTHEHFDSHTFTILHYRQDPFVLALTPHQELKVELRRLLRWVQEQEEQRNSVYILAGWLT